MVKLRPCVLGEEDSYEMRLYWSLNQDLIHKMLTIKISLELEDI